MRTREKIEEILSFQNPGDKPKIVSEENLQRTMYAILNVSIVQAELLLDIRDLLTK